MKDESRFWDRIATRYHRSPIKDLEAYQHKLSVSRRFLDPDAQVLEFGCGTGGTAIAHAPHVQHIHAIDVSEKMLDFARIQATEKNIKNVTFEKASIESLPAADASYDVILGLSILHLLENREAVLEKVFRLLKPGGVFISSTACMGDNLKLFKYIVPVGRALGLFPIVKVFQEEQLVEELTASGFTIEHQWRPKKNMAAFIVAGKEQMESGDTVAPVVDDRATASSRSITTSLLYI
jgi:2-polyprenyl-3-methyl-5-hydroxy-6-metoxy-1,4-benzoquinol methylase